METTEYTSDAYWKFLEEKKLVGSRCRNCGAVYLPPRPLCRSCGEPAMEWVEFEGNGKVETFSRIYFPTAELIGAGFGRDNPNCTAIVRLDEGPAISAQILGPDLLSTPDVAIGDQVNAAFVERNGRKILVFVKPA